MSEYISSFQNPLIKNVIKLNKSKERKQQNLITIEGLRECYHAVNSGIEIKKILYCSKLISENNLIEKLNIKENILFTDVAENVFETIVYRKGIENCIAIAQPQYINFNNLKLKENPLILVIDSVEKPGNLGAMLRTCDAAGVDAVIVCDPQTDVYNPNCIRASLGATFTKKVIVTIAESCIDWLKTNSINTFVTYLESAQNYTLENFTKPTAFVVGSEAYGINHEWLNHNFKSIRIPQNGKVDSMNVSNSAAVVLFEAVRQRGFTNV